MAVSAQIDWVESEARPEAYGANLSGDSRRSMSISSAAFGDDVVRRRLLRAQAVRNEWFRPDTTERLGADAPRSRAPNVCAMFFDTGRQIFAPYAVERHGAPPRPY